MLLHRYFGSHYRETIVNKELKVSDPNTFNDPFELLYNRKKNPDEETAEKVFKNAGYDYTPELLKKYIEHCKETCPDDSSKYSDDIKEKIRVVCLNAVNPSGVDPQEKQKTIQLLWAHYANSHQGARITFNIDDKAPIHEVKYQANLPEVDPFKWYAEEKFDSKELEPIMCTKNLAWKYEHEYRLIYYNWKSGTIDYTNYPIEIIEEVTFGCQCQKFNISRTMAECFLSGATHIKYYKSKIVPTAYQLTDDPIRFKNIYTLEKANPTSDVWNKNTESNIQSFCANNEDHARQLANEQYQTIYKTNNNSPWLSPQHTTCQLIKTKEQIEKEI